MRTSKKILAGTVFAILAGALLSTEALGQTTPPANPPVDTTHYASPASQTPATPPGWTKAQAEQWLLPNQQPSAVNSMPNGFTLNATPAQIQQGLRFFTGRYLDCRTIIGFLKCCRAAVPDQQKAWWKKYADAQRDTHALNTEALVAHVQGDWSQVNGSSGQFSLDSPLTSQYENVTGGGNGPPSSAETLNGGLGQMNQQFMQNEDANVKPHLGWYCDNSDFEVAVGKNLGECHYIGSKCGTSVLGVCLIKKEAYCCFNSPATLDIREHMLSEGIGNMGDAKHPNCGGITLAQLESGDAQDTATQDLEARMQLAGYLPGSWDSSVMQVQYTGSGSDIGDPARVAETQRTNTTVGNMDPGAASSSLDAEAQSLEPTSTTTDPTVAGQITFNAGYMSLTSGKPLVVQVARNGGLGMVSITVSTTAGTAVDGTDYVGVNQTLYWGNGDVSTKTITIDTMPHGGTGARSFTVVLSSPTGEATVNPYGTMNIDLQPNN